MFISRKTHGLKQFMNLLENVTKEVYTALNVSFFFFLPMYIVVQLLKNVKVHGRNSSISEVFKE